MYTPLPQLILPEATPPLALKASRRFPISLERKVAIWDKSNGTLQASDDLDDGVIAVGKVSIWVSEQESYSFTWMMSSLSISPKTLTNLTGCSSGIFVSVFMSAGSNVSASWDDVVAFLRLARPECKPKL